VRHASRYIPRRAYRTEPSEDSDLIVALFRFAIIIAFTLSAGMQPVYTVKWPATTMRVVAAVYTLGLMLAYVYSRQWLTQRRRQELLARRGWGFLLRHRIPLQRVSAVVVDLLLITSIIYDLRWIGDSTDLYFNFYFVVVAVAAIWFHRAGGVIAGAGATICVASVVWSVHGPDDGGDALQAELPVRALMYLVAGLVIGYLARALDAERRQRERFDWELSMARQVQAAMLPDELPKLESYDLGAHFTPASAVGGDYYDALVGPDGRLFIAVADVAGKSVYGVMHLSLVRSALREAILEGHAPAEIAVRLNATLAKTLPPNSFVSLFCGALDPLSGSLHYANCGHVPPVLIRVDAASEAELLATGDIVLGVEANAPYREAVTRLAPGDRLVCCTDGLTEAMGSQWEPFDTTGVAATAREQPTAGARDLAEAIAAAADRHRQGAPLDDTTIFVVQRVAGVPAMATPEV
jgi:serine phosphatase RsbU (regulator of sigma subunit)